MIPTPQRRQTLSQLADLILEVERPHPLRVAIDGIDAAGKTTLGAISLVNPDHFIGIVITDIFRSICP